MSSPILASGYSSVAGHAWYLVSDEKNEAVVVTRSDEPAREEERWTARLYRPGSKFDAGQPVSEERRRRLLAQCQTVDWQAHPKQINWNDLKSADELYWSIKENA